MRARACLFKCSPKSQIAVPRKRPEINNRINSFVDVKGFLLGTKGLPLLVVLRVFKYLHSTRHKLYSTRCTEKSNQFQAVFYFVSVHIENR